jgi:hypothetical protein
MIGVSSVDTIEFGFQIITTTKTLVFKASSLEEKDEWVMLLEAAKEVASPQFLFSNPDSSLSWILVRECVKNFRETVTEEIPYIIEESTHPYPPNIKFRKMIHIEGNPNHIYFIPTHKKVLNSFSLYSIPSQPFVDAICLDFTKMLGLQRL